MCTAEDEVDDATAELECLDRELAAVKEAERVAREAAEKRRREAEEAAEKRRRADRGIGPGTSAGDVVEVSLGEEDSTLR